VTVSSCSSIGASSGTAPTDFKSTIVTTPFALHGKAKNFLFALKFFLLSFVFQKEGKKKIRCGK